MVIKLVDKNMLFVVDVVKMNGLSIGFWKGMIIFLGEEVMGG